MESENAQKEISDLKIEDGKFHFLLNNGNFKNDWLPEDRVDPPILNKYIEQKKGIIELNTNISLEKVASTPVILPKYRKANLETDTVKRIYSITKYHEKDTIILANVEWNIDALGYTPIACPVTNNYLKEKAPELYLEFLRSL